MRAMRAQEGQTVKLFSPKRQNFFWLFDNVSIFHLSNHSTREEPPVSMEMRINTPSHHA